ncbi:hypothetical protein C8R43DRAFT_1122144 [Mycena crocata]|nr:hypothetical protein C8R43DRAFT_1122144 [Mycena crocata]
MFHPVQPAPQLLQCTPRYFPDDGHENKQRHSANPNGFFYGIHCASFSGVVTSQASRNKILSVYKTARWFEAATWEDLEKRWATECTEFHAHGSRPRESIPPSSPSSISSFSSWASSIPANTQISSFSELTDLEKDLLLADLEKCEQSQAPQRREKNASDAAAAKALLQRQRDRNRAMGESLAAQEAELRRQEALNRLDAELDDFYEQCQVPRVDSVRCVSSCLTGTPTPSRSPTKAHVASGARTKRTKAPSAAVRSATGAAGTALRSPTKMLGFAPPYRPGDRIGPTPLLPPAGISQGGDSSDDGLPALQTPSNSSEDDDDDTACSSSSAWARAEDRDRDHIHDELAQLYIRTGPAAFAAYRSRAGQRQVLLYAVSGHNTIFQDRDRAMAVLRDSPDADLMFTYDEAAVLRFIDDEAARMSSLKTV